MTVMRASEVRLNLILSLSMAALGVVMRLVGALALKYDWFLPEYNTVAKGTGGALILLGLLWAGMTLIKRAQVPREKPVR